MYSKTDRYSSWKVRYVLWRLSGKADVSLVMTTFQKAYESRNTPCGLMFHSDRGTLRLVSSSFKYLKKHSQTALSKGYPFLEKDCTTFRESKSCRNANAVYCVPRSEWNMRPQGVFLLSSDTKWNRIRLLGTGLILSSVKYFLKMCLLYWLYFILKIKKSFCCTSKWG